MPRHVAGDLNSRVRVLTLTDNSTVHLAKAVAVFRYTERQRTRRTMLSTFVARSIAVPIKCKVVPKMKTYWFELVLTSFPQSFEELAEAAFEAGCDDGTPAMCEGTASIGFAREASSLDDAIRSAVKQVESIGCVIEKIEIDDLDALREAA